jgi:hypothetical protein
MGSNRSGKMSPAAIERAEKERQAVALRQSGATFDQIATEMGLANRGAAHKMVQRGLTRWMHESDEELRAVELARSETIIGRLWPKIDRDDPDPKAIDAYLRLADYRAKLAGLYAAKKTVVGMGIEVAGEVRHVAGARRVHRRPRRRQHRA